jgi:hypothetical protein
MQIPNGHDDLGCIKLNHVFRESLLRLEYLVEFSSSDEGHDEVESERGLEEIVHAHKVRVVA